MSALWLATPRLRPSASFVKLQCSPIPHMVFVVSKTLNYLGNTFPSPILHLIHKLGILNSFKPQNINVDLNVFFFFCPTPGGDRSPWDHHAEQLWTEGVHVVLDSSQGELCRPWLEHLTSCNALIWAWDFDAPAQLCVKAEAGESCQQPWMTC